MNVTFVLPGLDMSGGNRVVSTYARLLSEHGHSVNVVAAGLPLLSWRGRFRQWRKEHRWSAHPIKDRRSHFDGLRVKVHSLIDFRPVADGDVPDADVVVATWWETAEWVNGLRPTKGAKVYLIQHHELFEYVPVDRVKATYRLPLHKIAVAPWLVDVMRDEYGDSDVDLANNAVDHAVFHAPPRGKQAVPTVGLMFSVAEFKSIDVAIEVLRRLKQSLPDLRLVSFGLSQPVGLDFMAGAMEFHLSPTQHGIRDCYSKVDVWLSSSRSEGFNLPALEAMACRTPVVSTRTGWPATAIVDGLNGFLADVGDSDGLFRGAVSVLTSGRADWEAMSMQAFQIAATLTWENSYSSFIDALRKACGRPRGINGNSTADGVLD